MHPEFLTSSYLQYKSDTDAVASWLATTAKKCGYPQDLVTSSNPEEKQQRSSQRLKGKARKMARQAASQGNSKPQQRKLPTYTIAIKDFVSLAEYVAGKTNPPVRVPASFITALNRAISVRRDYGSQLGSQLPDVPQTHDANECHNYFIGVLEHVRDVLCPRMPSDKLPIEELSSRADQKTTDVTEKLANKFEKLEVEEPSEAFLQAPDVAVAKGKTTELEANYEAERIQDFEEAFLSFTLLLQDFNKFRTVIMQTWYGYKLGMFGLVASSLMTNTALDLARTMEEDMKAILDKHGGSEKFLQFYFLGLCLQTGEDQAFKERPGDAMNFRMYEDTKNIYWPTYQLLRAFAQLVDNTHLPQYKPNFYGHYVPTSDRSAKSSREKFQEDQQVLMEALPEFCYLCLRTTKMPAEDELARGLREMFKTREIPFWLVFATQVFLDIHHELRDQVDRGYNELYNTARVIHNNIETTLKFHKSLRVETWPRENDQVFRQIQSEINNFVVNDPIQQAKTNLGRLPGEPFKLQKWHPIYCGLWTYSLQAMYQEVGITFAGAWGSILYTFHLYSALQQEKLLRSGWKDMELFTMLHGDDVFAGGRPKTPADYLKRFALSMGYSASSFARDRRNNAQLEASKKGPKGFNELAPVMRMFKDRFCYASGQIDLTRQDLNKILAKSNWEKGTDAKDNEEGILSFVRNENPAKHKRESEIHRQLNATDLLENLRNALQAEILEFTFDYLVFHQFCWIFLRHIKKACEEDLKAIYGVGCIEKENQLPYIVGYIFMAATNIQRLGNVLMKKKSEQVTSRLMQSAAAACHTLIANDAGEITCKVLSEQYGLQFDIVEETSDDETGQQEVQLTA